jgi:hypothetical protein
LRESFTAIDRLIICLLLGLFVASAALCLEARQPEAKSRTSAVKNTVLLPGAGDLTPSEQSLVSGSKKAIIETGITESYFMEHFTLLQVVDQPADRRVRWKFSINGYEAIINDVIGYYTEGNRRIDTHAIAQMLGRTSNIQRTIARSRALKIMRLCIGNFSNPFVEYRPYSFYDQAELMLVAQSRQVRKEERNERAAKEVEVPSNTVPGGRDAIEEEEVGGGPRIIIGAVNLQTGKCIKGAAIATP